MNKVELLKSLSTFNSYKELLKTNSPKKFIFASNMPNTDINVLVPVADAWVLEVEEKTLNLTVDSVESIEACTSDIHSEVFTIDTDITKFQLTTVEVLEHIKFIYRMYPSGGYTKYKLTKNENKELKLVRVLQTPSPYKHINLLKEYLTLKDPLKLDTPKIELPKKITNDQVYTYYKVTYIDIFGDSFMILDSNKKVKVYRDKEVAMKDAKKLTNQHDIFKIKLLTIVHYYEEI